ncbi:hypothetical protein [Paenibacillus sp. MBLB4367]|uniref:hypothetical protein n=1 Tax=Paenibacillus sp. MBLB4367 TaxID=3384767 RepID=UPI0039081207
MKKGLMMIVVLLAIGGLMAAMAYSSASVTNASTLNVKNTNEALVALIAADANSIGNKDRTASYENGKLTFNFGKGLGGQTFGLQRNSTYEWEKLFKVKNNSNETIVVQFREDQSLSGVNDSIRSIRLFGLLNEWVPLGTNDIAAALTTIILLPGEERAVDIKMDTNGTAPTGAQNYNIIVESKVKLF